MTAMPMNVALRSAMDVMLERDDDVVIFGEDVGYFGGVFRCTDGLQAKYGRHRVFDAPIAEGGIIGTALGMCAYGLRPVVEIQFADYVYPALDQLISEAARLRYRSGAEFTAPLVVRMPCGGGIHGGQTHSQSPESLFTHVCGLKTVLPSNPYDAKGLLIAAIEDNDPVIFLEPKRIYNGPFDGHHERPVVPWSGHPLGDVPDGHYSVPLGCAVVRRSGEDLTVLAYGTMVHVAEAAADETGVDAEIIDLRTLLPLDTDTIAASVAQDRPVRHRPRGDAHERARGRAVGPGAGALLLLVGGADRAGDRLGHAVPARPGVGLLPRPRPRRRRLQAGDGRLTVGTYVVKLPDVGEGVAEAELVEWHVAVGDVVTEDQPIADVMTDKATVELPSPVSGTIARLGAEAGDVVAIGSELVWIETDGEKVADSAAERARRPSRTTRRLRRSHRLPRQWCPRRPADAARHVRTAPRRRARRTGGAPPRRRPRHRPGGGRRFRSRWPDRPRRSRPPARRAPDRARRRRRHPVGRRRRRRGGQDRRPAPQHRPADAGVDAANPPLHVRRRGRRHRRRTVAMRSSTASTRAPARGSRCSPCWPAPSSSPSASSRR